MIKTIKLAVILSLPLLLLEVWGKMHVPTMCFAFLFCLFLSISLTQLSHKSWLQLSLKIILVLLYLFTLFMTFIEAVTFDFTGQGFTHEFYYHISLDAFRVGLDKYGWGLAVLLALMSVMVYGLLRWTQNTAKPHSSAYLVFFLSLILFNQTVSGRFLLGWHEYYQESDEAVDKQQINFWLKNGFINRADVPLKQLVEASKGEKNLILIYLESFNQFFVDTPPFNRLTPGINQLGQRFTAIPHESSAYVTIEGIVSSQCGTLLTMKKGNDSMMKASHFLANLPCLGDVLKEAGYQQYYLGGAKMEFAGKGDFLRSHGYDYIRGLEYWLEQGLDLNTNVWGLGDDELFNQAFDVVVQAHGQTAPFNLTLLTLGTHLPGYTYPECDELNLDDHPFLAAIQCTDYLLSRFIQRLEAGNYLDNTLLLVVADHGVFPNPKMKEVFGDLVNDRRLIGFTNHSVNGQKQAMASYDLAPSVLDWLEVSHNTQFLFGQSIDDDSHSSHKHLTRYKDWQNGQLVKNPKKACADIDETLLNVCQKNQLGSWLTQQHKLMSKQDQVLALGCSPDLNIDLEAAPRVFEVAGVNLYEKFHYNGYYMQKRQFTNGWFALELNEEQVVTDLKYWKQKDMPESEWQQKLDQSLGSNALLIRVNSSGKVSVDSKINQLWQTQELDNINLCQ